MNIREKFLALQRLLPDEHFGIGEDGEVAELQVPMPSDAEIEAAHALNLADEAAFQAKEDRDAQVKQITVTVDGMEFDGDEVSQGRMARAISSSDSGDTTLWKLADNTVAAVSHDQLKQALRLAGEEQTRLWMS